LYPVVPAGAPVIAVAETNVPGPDPPVVAGATEDVGGVAAIVDGAIGAIVVGAVVAIAEEEVATGATGFTGTRCVVLAFFRTDTFRDAVAVAPTLTLNSPTITVEPIVRDQFGDGQRFDVTTLRIGDAMDRS
jgi:hypothetical protein